MAKIQGATAYATTSYGSTPSQAIDGSTLTRWESNNTYAATVNDVFVLGFPRRVTPKQIRLLFRTWGQDLHVGYSHTGGTVKSSYTEIKVVNIATEPNDSLGNKWNVVTDNNGGMDVSSSNVLLLPENEIAAQYWAIWINNATGVDRLRIWEISLHDTVGDEGINPTLPNSIPVPPFTASPSPYWKRTEYSTPGPFSHTPDADTKLMFLVAQGAGAGGRVVHKLDGSITPVSGPGEATTIASAAGTILTANGGANDGTGGLLYDDRGKSTENWIRYDYRAGINGGVVVAGGALASPAGANTGVLGATTGASFILVPAGQPVTNTFTGTSEIKGTVTYEKFARDAAYGLKSQVTTANESGYVEYSFLGYAGRNVTINVRRNIGYPTINAAGRIRFNGVLRSTFSGVSEQTEAFTYAMVDGVNTVRLEFGNLSPVQAGTFASITSVVLSGTGAPGVNAGGSGALSRLYMAPKPLTGVIGKGGVGQAGEQPNVTAAQNSTRGSGGAPGGNGGDGVIVVYEYKGFMAYGDSPLPTFANYNVAPGTEVAGASRTDYIGLTNGGQRSFTHKLREKTKNVFIIMVGAGGSRELASISQPDSTVVVAGAGRWEAKSGWNSTGTSGVSGGVFVSDNDSINSGDGVAGIYGYDTLATSPIAGNYGRGSGSYPYKGAGGAGAYGFFALSQAQMASRSIDILVGNNTATTYQELPGAVFVFETESDNVLQVTQVVEELLVKASVSNTQITQSSELLFAKSPIANTQTSQTPELMLVKEGEQNNWLQVSYANIGFVVDAEDPATAVTQTAEQLLVKQPVTQTMLTQSAEMILARVPRIPYRMTQVAELVFVSEIPSVFWLNFGEVNDPVKDQIYTSLTGRATSVQPGAYIQLEGPHAEGTTMFVNGVDVGLSSPIANNDRVQIVGGIPNWWQASINVYTYYLVNGEVTREQVGMWLFKHVVRTPTKPRAYAAQYTNNKWQFLKNGLSTAQLPKSIIGRAYAALSNTLSVLVSRGYSALGATLGQLVSSAQQATNSLGQMVVQAKHQLAEGAQSLITKTYAAEFEQNDFILLQTQDDQNTVTFDSGVGVGADRFDMTVINPKVKYGIVHDVAQGEINGPGMVQFENVEFIESGVNSDAMEIEFETPIYVGVELTDFHFEYNAVGKSYSDVQEYEAVLSTGFAAPFLMGFTDTIAYSVLQEFAFVGVRSGGTGLADIPQGTADLSQVKFGIGELFGNEKSHGHTEFVQRTPEVHGAHDFHNFQSFPVYSGAIGISTYKTGIIKRTEHVERVQISWIRIKAQMGVAQNTPYRPQQATNGRGKASLYQGFDTLSDVLDFTANYDGVTTLQKFNGYVYNLDVDKTFVCEVYYNGPISGLMQGG